MEENRNKIKHSATGKYLAVFGSILLLAVPASVIIFVVNMFFLFQETTLHGAGDTQNMADGISSALVPVVLGLFLVIPGLVCLVISLAVFKYYRPWVYWVSLTASILGLLMIPFGTVLALITLIILVVKRSSFHEFETNI